MSAAVASAGLLATRIFTADDQELFARLTGDRNPLHMDAVAARKTQAGAPAVHGVNAMLWALDQVADKLGGVAAVSARFERFILTGVPVELVATESRGKLRLELRTGSRRAALLVATFGDRAEGAAEPGPARSPEPVPVEPRRLAFADCAGADGAFGLVSGDPEPLYRRLTSLLGADSVRGIAALSTLVGMVVPGLHSILSGIEVVLGPTEDGDALAFRTEATHEVYSLVTLATRGPGFSATVEAFVRPEPTAQASLAEVVAGVPAGACAGVRALVIGGSRGLGEVVAKIVAAGGGQVCITYAVGLTDAERVRHELEEAGRSCVVFPFDAGRPVAAQLAALPFLPTQVYYFATPRIFRQRDGFFSSALLAEYERVYCAALFELCESLSGGEPVRVFYPSSVAVEERPRDLTEYAMAKAASEILCQDIDRDLPGVSVLVERLPRIETDQTATLTAVESRPALEVMREVVFRMSALPG